MYNNYFEDGNYGIEVILDFHSCDVSKFNAEDLINFVRKLIEIADMEAHGESIVWEDHAAQDLHLQGTSVFQWIKTSNIVLHTLTLTKLALLNLFTCKPFDAPAVIEYGKEFFKTEHVTVTVVKRGEYIPV